MTPLTTKEIVLAITDLFAPVYTPEGQAHFVATRPTDFPFIHQSMETGDAWPDWDLVVSLYRESENKTLCRYLLKDIMEIRKGSDVGQVIVSAFASECRECTLVIDRDGLIVMKMKHDS